MSETEPPRRSSSVLFALGQLTAEVKGYHEEMRQNTADMQLRLADHDRRIIPLERWRWIQIGGMAVLATAGGYLFEVLKPGLIK